MKALDPLSRIRVVLSRPSHPGNVGAAARAMKTMGLARLYLVRPKSFPHADARAMAAGASDVLGSAQVCKSLAEALRETTFSVAFSARPRELSHPPLAARGAAEEIAAAARRGEVALVFGNETLGLSNKEVMQCTRIARIPADSKYASLNLAQAVQVMAYEVRIAALAPAERPPEIEYATHEELERFYADLERRLTANGTLHARDPRKLMDRLRRLFAKARLEKVEINILRGMWRLGIRRTPGGSS